MSVIVSDLNNSSYDGNLATVNGFYRAEAYNLGSDSTGLALSYTTGQPINVTFANAGNCQGVVLSLTITSNSTVTSDVIAHLQEAVAVGSFNVSTERINIAGHGLSDGNPVSFTSTETLPTGITANRIYYVINKTTDDFQISETLGGSVRTLSGTPSGTATCWVSRVYKTLTPTEIHGAYTSSGAQGYDYSQVYCPFKFAVPYAVDTTASKWRFNVSQTNGTGAWYITTSNTTAAFYVTWCDNKVSHTNDDCLIVVDACIINKTASIAGVLGTGVTDYGTSGVVCRNTDYSIDNVALLRWENPAISSYTFTIKDTLWLGIHSGFRIGTETNPIKIAQQAILYFAQPTVGSITRSLIKSPLAMTTTVSPVSKSSIFVYGQIPSIIKTTLASQANSGQAHLITTDDTSAVWSADDYIVVGKQDVSAQGDTALYQISSIAGTDVTLKTNLATNNRLAGGIVLRLNGFGVKIYGYTNALYGSIVLHSPSNVVFSGVEIQNMLMWSSAASYYYCLDDSTYRSRYLFQDITWRADSTTLTSGFSMGFVPKEGILFNRVYPFRGGICPTITGSYNALIRSGEVEIKNCVGVSIYSGLFASPGSYTQSNIHDNRIENGYRYGLGIAGINLTFVDNYFWGIPSATVSNYYTVSVNQLISPREIGRNTYNKCGTAISFAAALCANCVDKDSIFGNEVANTNDINFLAGAIVDYELNSPSGVLTVSTTNLGSTVPGSRFRVTDYNGTANDDRNWLTNGYIVRTGSGLTDETVRTSGTGKYAIRFEPIGDLSWSQNIPTGNIQNKTMTISVWIKINSIAYYGGSIYTNPTLSVKYDNAITVTSVAIDSTEWQQLAVIFTPTTTYGQVTLTIGGTTDVVGADAYFYADDFNIAYPAGVAVDLGGVDIWASGLPVTPVIATVPSLGGVWDEVLTAHNIPGTFGSYEKKLLTVTKFLGLS